MRSSTTPDFWQSYARLPSETKQKARRAYRLWRHNPRHPSLRFKKVGDLWSIRIGPDHRAVALMQDDMLYWFWIGDHREYERLIAESQ
ncbi:MAG: hypothetical protein FJ279_22090 [Planctomycetes bacterium]|nr:hypothetical protein [Planctomycetota bacterium]MBM4081872.1 hypothetical protein [Planctomycetota bacterium]